MKPGTSADWHFYIMIIVSIALFLVMIRIVSSKKEFLSRKYKIIFLAIVVVVIGMLLGKYGSKAGLPWWVYYPVPMLMTVLLPPFILRFDRTRVMLYLIMSVMSAPLIHTCFSFFLGWKEYMPFWNIPSMRDLMH